MKEITLRRGIRISNNTDSRMRDVENSKALIPVIHISRPIRAAEVRVRLCVRVERDCE